MAGPCKLGSLGSAAAVPNCMTVAVRHMETEMVHSLGNSAVLDRNCSRIVDNSGHSHRALEEVRLPSSVSDGKHSMTQPLRCLTSLLATQIEPFKFLLELVQK